MANFQFFNFDGQQQHQAHEKQNVASDSGWYRQVVENGRALLPTNTTNHHANCPSFGIFPFIGFDSASHITLPIKIHD